MSLSNLLSRPIRIIYSPRKVVAEIAEKPGTAAAMLVFFLSVTASVSLDISVSLPRLEIVNIFTEKIPTPDVDIRFVIARQIAYFFLSIGVLFGVLWIASAILKKKSGNMLSVLSSIMNGFLILLVFITLGALVSLSLPPSTIVVYGYEARGVGFRDITITGTYNGFEVPAGVREELLVNGSKLHSPLAYATILRAEILDRSGLRVNLTGMSDAEKKEALENGRQRVVIEGLKLSEASIDDKERIAVPFNISLVTPQYLNWSSAQVESYNYIDATIIGATEMSNDEVFLTYVRRALSPLAWLWLTGLGAYSLNVVYGLGRLRMGGVWAAAFSLMTLMGLV